MRKFKEVYDDSRKGTSTQSLLPTPAHSYATDGRCYRPDEHCLMCKGGGFLHPLNENGEPHYHLVVPCACYVKSAKAYLAGHEYQEKQGANLKSQTFANFRLAIGPGGSREAVEAARAWCDPKAEFIWLLIYGGTGNGKTHLCNAALTALFARGRNARLVTASGFVAALRMGMDDHTTDTVMAEYQQVIALIVDDLGAGMKHPSEKGSEWEWGRIEELLVARYEAMRPTMCTTNLDLSQLPERIASRFSDKQMARVVLNAGGDYRTR